MSRGVYKNEKGVYCTPKNTGYSRSSYTHLAQKIDERRLSSYTQSWGQAEREFKDRLTAYALWEHWGIFGIHNLYMGRMKKFLRTILVEACLLLTYILWNAIPDFLTIIVTLCVLLGVIKLFYDFMTDFYEVLQGNPLDDQGKQIFRPDQKIRRRY